MLAVEQLPDAVIGLLPDIAGVVGDAGEQTRGRDVEHVTLTAVEGHDLEQVAVDPELHLACGPVPLDHRSDTAPTRNIQSPFVVGSSAVEPGEHLRVGA